MNESETDRKGMNKSGISDNNLKRGSPALVREIKMENITKIHKNYTRKFQKQMIKLKNKKIK